jgi:hypothetical protein
MHVYVYMYTQIHTCINIFIYKCLYIYIYRLRGGSLKCVDSADIYLLLKSSDRIVFDIENMFNLCENCEFKRPNQFSLIVRKWANLDPAMEFRVFIGKNQILGISQRDCSSYYDHLINDKDDLEDKIVEFFETKINGKFYLELYSIDIFIDRKQRIWIIDFNPFGDPSSGLLFEWHELKTLYQTIIPINESNYETDFEFRIILNKNETFVSALGSSRGPIDVTLAPDFHKFMEICKNQDKEEKNEEN